MTHPIPFSPICYKNPNHYKKISKRCQRLSIRLVLPMIISAILFLCLMPNMALSQEEDEQAADSGIPADFLEAMGASDEQIEAQEQQEQQEADPSSSQPYSTAERIRDNLAQNLKFSGYVSSINSLKWGGLDFPYEMALVRQRFHLTSSYDHEYFAVRVDLDFISDMPWHFEDLEFLLGKAYFDIYLGDFTFRIGQQTVGWGKAVAGIFGIDLINPLDLREFMLNDINELKIPIPMIKIEWNYYPVGIEVLWIPLYIPHRFPEQGTIWYRDPQTMMLTGGLPIDLEVTLKDYNYPSMDLENSQAAFKFTSHFLGVDLDVFYEYVYYDYPIFSKEIQIDPVSPGISITPRYERIHAAGFSLETVIWELVGRIDAIYMNNTHYDYLPHITQAQPIIIPTPDTLAAINDFNDHQGVLQKDTVRYLVGLDYNYGPEFIISVQFMHDIILWYDSRMISELEEKMLFATIRSSWLRETLTFELMVIYDIDYASTLTRFFTHYKLTENFTITGGVEIFTGDYDSMIGYYWKNDLVDLKLKYSF